MVEMHKMLKIKSYDGHILEAKYDSMIINRFFYDLLEGSEIPTEALEMPNELLKKSVLENVIRYCEFAHTNHPPKI